MMSIRNIKNDKNIGQFVKHFDTLMKLGYDLNEKIVIRNNATSIIEEVKKWEVAAHYIETYKTSLTNKGKNKIASIPKK